MAIEIEAKMKVDNLDDVRARLREAGARRQGAVTEINTFFDKDDRSLLASDEGLRIRRATDAETGQSAIAVTYKGPRQRGMLKSREEIELSVGDWDAAVTLFAKLGFGVVLSFEKRRETWSLEACTVELDQLPHLGTFVEIEGPSESDVLKVRTMLSLADRPIVRASYAALLGEYVQEHGRGAGVVRF